MTGFGSDTRRRALLDLLLREEGLTPLASLTTRQRKGADSVPLSFTQEQMWFLVQLAPGNPFYNNTTALCLKGPLDVIALEKSFNEIVRRHESLRTTFPGVEGIPVQRIASALTVTLPVVDLMKTPETERAAQVMELVNEEARCSFDLTQGPLLRVKLLRLALEEYVLVIATHHIIIDGLSKEVLFRELAALYEAFSIGRPSPLPELPFQYADFVHWQHERMQGDVLEQRLSYWKKQLGGAPELLELPIDRPRTPMQTFRGASQSVALPEAFAKELKRLSRQEGVTLFMTLLAGFQVLLSRITGQDDIVVGSPVGGRNWPEVEGLIGLFINILVLRVDLSGNPSFRELLRRVRDVVLGAVAHQEVPFDKMMRELRSTRNLSRNSLFQVMFGFHQISLEENLRLPGLTVNKFPLHTGVAKFDLTLSMTEGPTSLGCSLKYNSDLFDAATITRMLGHLQRLLEGIIADPDRRISELPLLTEAERQQLLVGWNESKKDYHQDRCVHELFEAQVERTPDAVAVIFGDQQLTYRELNGRANQLAHYLRKCGVGPDVLVGIYMERSVEMLVGLFGVLKSGGAYVPLDPNYPMERLAFMLQDTHAPVLLTQQRLIEDSVLSKIEGLDSQLIMVCLDTDWKKFIHESTDNPQSGATADNLAYVIYTSGSTGKSKGVMVTHGSLLNAYLAWEEIYQLRQATTAHLQMASFSFDVFSGDCMRALCSGKKLVLCPTEFLLDAPELYRLMLREQVDCAEFVPVVMRNLCQHLEENKGSLEFMRILVIGSETWYVEEFQKLHRLCGPNTQLINSYGLTEATVDSSYFRGSVQGSAPYRSVPIGRPFPNTQLYILDRYLQPVPVGVPGELHIGGAGLARGYLNRPDFTAEKFIPNPFSDDPGARLYKTGDSVRYLPTGNIEFRGRIDHQVKIRGFRIELGEVEAVLGQHPSVREAVVVAHEYTPNDKRLAAYIVPHQAPAPTRGELQGFIKARLPDHMVPAAFIIVDTLPLTPTGKVDRRALPAPDTSRPDLTGTFVAPRNSVEEVLAGIWAKVLKLERIGVHDNFFELGGHSLLATQVMSLARTAFQLEIALRKLFENPTVAGLAVQIVQLKAKESSPEEMIGLLADLESISDEEAQSLLAREIRDEPV